MAAGEVSSPIEPIAGLAGFEEGFKEDVDILAGHAEGGLGPEKLALFEALLGLRLTAGDEASLKVRIAFAGEVVLDLFVQDDGPVREANLDGFAGAKEALDFDLAAGQVPGQLAGRDGEVFGGREPEGAQTVAVEVGDGVVSVAGDEGGGAVASSQVNAHRAVELGEIGIGVDDGLGLGKEGEQRLGDAHPAREEGDEHVVEIRGVGPTGADDGRDLARQSA